MMDCLDDDQLDEYALGRTNRSERDEVDSHLGKCEECRARLNDTRYFIAAVKAAGEARWRQSLDALRRWVHPCHN